jgi:predicted nuclease with TOPRIM domain
LQRDLQCKGDTSYAIRKDIDNASFELQKLKEERARDQCEIDRLRDVCAQKERENTDSDQRIKATDYDLFKLQERATELTKVAELRDFDLKKTND